MVRKKLPKDFDPKEFMTIISEMVDKKLSDFKKENDKKREDFKPPQKIQEREQFTATFKGGKRENAQTILKDLYQLMLKHGITEIVYAIRTKKL